MIEDLFQMRSIELIRRAFVPGLFLIGCVTLATGCGKSGPPLVDVKGVVKLDGKPLGSAEMTFIPDPSNKHVTPGNAYSDADGSYVARYQDRFGLAEGKYIVTVRKSEVTDASKVPDAMKNDQAQLEMMGLTKQTLKKDYSSPESSPFKIEVSSKAEPHNFDLDSKK